MSLLISSASKENLGLSIDKSVDLDLARRCLGDSFVQELFLKSSNEQVHCWGLAEHNGPIFQNLADYDEVLLKENGTGFFKRYGIVIGKIHNTKLGSEIWTKGEVSWVNIIFLANIQTVTIAKAEVLSALGQNTGSNVQGPSLGVYSYGTISEHYSSITFSNDYSAKNVSDRYKRRVGHQGFATQVKKNYESKCAICGIHEKEFLVAGHISAWAYDEKNRVNPENGLCLCSMHDTAFEHGYISLDDDYKIILHDKIDNKSTLYQQLAMFKGKKINPPLEHAPDINLLKAHREKHSFS